MGLGVADIEPDPDPFGERVEDRQGRRRVDLGSAVGGDEQGAAGRGRSRRPAARSAGRTVPGWRRVMPRCTSPADRIALADRPPWPGRARITRRPGDAIGCICWAWAGPGAGAVRAGRGLGAGCARCSQRHRSGRSSFAELSVLFSGTPSSSLGYHVREGVDHVTAARSAPGLLELRDSASGPAGSEPRPADDRRVRRPVRGRAGSSRCSPGSSAAGRSGSPTSSTGSTRPTSTGSSPPRSSPTSRSSSRRTGWPTTGTAPGIVVDDGEYGPTVEIEDSHPRRPVDRSPGGARGDRLPGATRRLQPPRPRSRGGMNQ